MERSAVTSKPGHVESPLTFGAYLDPELRSWEALTLLGYGEQVRNLLKIEALTQATLHVPAGYRLDNPVLLSMLAHGDGGTEAERRAFRAVMSDFIAVGVHGFDDLAGHRLDRPDHWEALERGWIGGSYSTRDRTALISCVSFEQARRLAADGADATARALVQVRRDYGIRVDSVAATLAGLGLHATEGRSLQFDTMLEEGLFVHRDAFDGLTDTVRLKLERIVECHRRQGAGRLSRSLIKDPESCRALGVAHDDLLTDDELGAALPAVSYYHGLAFARSQGARITIASVSPRPTGLAASLRGPALLDLSGIGFEAIHRLRTEHAHRFYASVNDLARARASGGRDAMARARKAHSRLLHETLFAKADATAMLDVIMKGVSAGIGLVSTLGFGADTPQRATEVFRAFASPVTFGARHVRRRLQVSAIFQPLSQASKPAGTR